MVIGERKVCGSVKRSGLEGFWGPFKDHVNMRILLAGSKARICGSCLFMCSFGPMQGLAVLRF